MYSNLSSFMSNLVSHGKDAQGYLDKVGDTVRVAASNELIQLASEIGGYTGLTYSSLTGLVGRLANAGNDVQGQLDHEPKSIRAAAAADLVSLVGSFRALELDEGYAAGTYTELTNRFTDLMSSPNDLGTWVERTSTSQMVAANAAWAALAASADVLAGPLAIFRNNPSLFIDTDHNLVVEDTGTGTGTGTLSMVDSWVSRDRNAHTFTIVGNPVVNLNVINGHPAILFHDRDCAYKEAAILSGSSGLVYIVNRPEATSLTGILMTLVNTSAATARYLKFSRSNSPRIRIQQRDNDTADDLYNSSGTMSANTNYVSKWMSDGSIYTLGVNGSGSTSLFVTGGANNGNWVANTTGLNRTVIGADYYNNAVNNAYRGSIAAIVAFSGTTLTAADRTAIQAYLGTKYGITMGA